MRSGIRFFLLGLIGLLVLAMAPAAFGDGTTDQLAVPGWTSDCGGFLHETLDGTVMGCTPNNITFIHAWYSAAADGSVVFMADDNGSGGDVGSIWLVRPDGTAAHLDGSTWDFDPTISYDGSKVTFARADPVTGASDIYTVNSDGSDLQLVVSGGGTNDLRMPSISPDGSTIAYWCGPADAITPIGQGCGPLTDGSYRESGVMRVNVDGTDPRMIVIGAGDALESSGPSGLSWSPDSQWLSMDGLLQVDLGNNEVTTQRQIFEYHTDGTDLFDNADPTRQITNEIVQGGPIFPQFSPDGSQILYMKTIDDKGNQGNFTYIIGVDGTNRQELPINYGEFIPTAIRVAPPALVDAMHITVPPVEALGLGAATQDLEAKNLTVGNVSYEYSATVGKNLVASQDPAAGAVAHRTAKVGPPVNLVLSLGAAPQKGGVDCVVPRIKGKGLKRAKQAIATAHCQVGHVKRTFSRTVKKGRVLSERPGAGKTLPKGAKVALTVSKGKRHS